MSIIFSYDFLVVASGVFFLAITAALVGCFSVYRRQSMVGDCLGHAAYPGVVIAFMLLRSRNPFFLTIGAALSCGLAYRSVQLMARVKKVQLDAALAIVLTGYFGLGMALKTFLQGNKDYINASQAGLKNYIFGSAAFMMKEHVYLILGASIFILLMMFLFRHELIYTIFDYDCATTLGINTKMVDNILLLLMIIVLALGLRSVGAVLISSFLIIPCLFANQLASELKKCLLLASMCGGFSALIGTYISSSYKGLSTGPCIIICMGLLTIIAFMVGFHSPLRRRK